MQHKTLRFTRKKDPLIFQQQKKDQKAVYKKSRLRKKDPLIFQQKKKAVHVHAVGGGGGGNHRVRASAHVRRGLRHQRGPPGSVFFCHMSRSLLPYV